MIAKLIQQWNVGVSYGVPVGPAAVRILTELLINDVDQSLAAEGIVFCRYSDDFRLFVDTERKARESLAFLATVLFKNHGMTIQESKTRILPTSDFIRVFRPSDQDQVHDHMSSWFDYLVSFLGVDTYEPIEYDELDPEQRDMLEKLNLWDIVNDAIHGHDKISPRLLGFVLRRIRQLGLKDDEDLLLANMGTLAHVFQDAVQAAVASVSLSEEEMHQIGRELLQLLVDDTVGHLEYHRAWILDPFARRATWNQSDQFVQLYNSFSDSFTRTAAILAMGRAHLTFWLRNKKNDLDQFEPWQRRAFLYAASALERDESHHWYLAMKSRLDVLERAVVAYARRNPMRT